jgi:hemolysin activation/secretion protein
VYGVRYNQNLERSPTFEPKLNYGLDYKAFLNGVVVAGSGQNLGKDVTVHPVSITYSGAFTLQQAEAGFSLSLAHNIPGGRDGESQAFSATRLGATSTYSILRYSANYARQFGRDWQLRLGALGQYTADALIPGEQFGAGGSTSVRGFTEREVANDYGTQVNAEVYTPNLCAAIQTITTQCRVLFFYDAARLERNKALPGEITLNNISSTGLGLRVNLDKFVSMQIDYGHVLSGASGSEKNRLHFKVNFSY